MTLLAMKRREAPKKCREQRHTFVPFVVSGDGMLAPEAVNTLKSIAQLLSEKGRHPGSSTFGCVKSQMGVAFVHATNLCLGAHT